MSGWMPPEQMATDFQHRAQDEWGFAWRCGIAIDDGLWHPPLTPADRERTLRQAIICQQYAAELYAAARRHQGVES